MISIEVYTNPDAFEPRDIARLYLESSQALGYDAGYSPEYQMILGSQWITSTTLFQLPFYDFNYILGSINSLSLWYEQQTGGDAVTKYNNLVQTPIPDISYSEYCQQMGLPAVNDTDLYEALDTFLSEKLNALEEEVFGRGVRTQPRICSPPPFAKRAHAITGMIPSRLHGADHFCGKSMTEVSS